MTTTDAEAIARIIDPSAFNPDAQTIGKPAYWEAKREWAVRTATAILSYLALRREAQEPACDCPTLGHCDGSCNFPPAPDGEPITLTYTNYRGETARRSVIPKSIWFGSTRWHPEPQWLLRATDVEKNAERDFALKGFGAPTGEVGRLTPNERFIPRLLLLDDLHAVCVGGRWDGWKFFKHPDGQWVSLKKLEEQGADNAARAALNGGRADE